jgi:hypothetical protein
VDNSLTLTLIIFLLSLSSSHFIFLLQKKQESCPKNLSILVVQITLLYKLLLMNLVASIVADIKETKFNKKILIEHWYFLLGIPYFFPTLWFSPNFLFFLLLFLFFQSHNIFNNFVLIVSFVWVWYFIQNTRQLTTNNNVGQSKKVINELDVFVVRSEL